MTTSTTTTASMTPSGAPRTPRHSITAWCVRHPWRVMISALVAAVGAVLLLGGGIATTPPTEQLVGDSAEAARITDSADFGTGPTETVVATMRQGLMSPEVAGRVGGDLVTAYTGVRGVARVGQPIPGQDGRSLVLPVELAADTDDSTATPPPADVVAPMLAATEHLATQHPELQIGQIGPGSVDREIDATLGADFQRAEYVSIPLTLAILLLAFGALLAAGVPLLLGLGSVVVALGLTAVASRSLVTVDPNAQSLVLLIGLAVGVDYALFVMRRVREERAAGLGVAESIIAAGATAGRAVVISGCTVIVAMAGMLVAGGLFTSLALGAILVVGVAVLASATVLPSVLAILGRRLDALSLPFARRRTARAGSQRSSWARLAAVVSRRPLAWAAACAALLGVLALPALGMRTSLGGVETLPQDLAVVAAHTQLEKAAPTEGTALEIVVAAPASDALKVRAALLGVSGDLRSLPHVTAVGEQVRASIDGTVSVLAVGVGLDGSDEALPALVERVRADVVPQVQGVLADVAGLRVHVGGQAAATDLGAWMDARLPWVVGFVLLLTLVVMTFSFGAPWLAVATVGLNLLSVGAAYGVVTLVFQGTWAERLLDFSSTGTIAAWLPMLMFVVLFGLSMDYHVFVTSRVREAYDAGHDPRAAVRIGVGRSAGVVTSAAAVMVGVFSVFGTLSSLEMKQLGVGLAVAVLLDATLVRGVLLPAILSLLGRRAHRGPSWIPVLHH